MAFADPPPPLLELIFTKVLFNWTLSAFMVRFYFKITSNTFMYIDMFYFGVNPVQFFLDMNKYVPFLQITLFVY